MNRMLLGAALLPVLCFGSGCGFDLGFRVDKPPPIAATVTGHSIKISEGIAVAVTVLDGDQPIEPETQVEFTSADPKIIDIQSTTAPEKFVIIGVAPGKANINFFVDGDLESTIVGE